MKNHNEIHLDKRYSHNPNKVYVQNQDEDMISILDEKSFVDNMSDHKIQPKVE